MRIEILRRERGTPPENSYWQAFEYTPESGLDTVATALTRLNEREILTDVNGDRARYISWECSCLQKKCGACAMVINGRPSLACDAFLRDCWNVVKLEPLRKFPVIEDLKTDRGVMFENLKRLKVWIESGQDGGDLSDSVLSEKFTKKQGRLVDNRNEAVYEAARCLQCGCCLEVCPNFYGSGAFAGTAGAMPLSRLLSITRAGNRKEIAQIYRKYVFEGCGKSLACRNICPAGIDVDFLFSKANLAAIR